MKLVIDTIQPWRELFKVLHNLTDTIMIKAKDDTIIINGIDRSHIIMVGSSFERDYFLTMNVDDDEEIYVDTKELLHILERAGKDETMELTTDDGNITIEYIDSLRTFKTRLIDENEGFVQKPQLDLGTVIEMNYDELLGVFKDVAPYSDTLTFDTENESLTLKCNGINGDYNKKAFVDIVKNDNTLTRASYSLEKLQLISQFKSSGKNQNVTIEYDTELPIDVRFESYDYTIEFFLAPRLDTED